MAIPSGHPQTSEKLKDNLILGKGCELWKCSYISENTLLSLLSCFIQLIINAIFEAMLIVPALKQPPFKYRKEIWGLATAFNTLLPCWDLRPCWTRGGQGVICTLMLLGMAEKLESSFWGLRMERWKCSFYWYHAPATCVRRMGVYPYQIILWSLSRYCNLLNKALNS